VGVTALISDSSAIVAILKDEPDAAEFMAVISREVTRVSAASMLESAMVITPSRFADLDQLLEDAEITVVPFDGDQAKIARDAFAQYGKRSGSKAQLNFGDCMSYALAKVTGEPLLFKGDDFTYTDIESARG
jgi:ribonuclease VapC